MGRNDKGYNDPTADIAVGRVMNEQKRLNNQLKRPDETPTADHKVGGRRSWNDILEEFKEIDKGKRD